MKKNNIYISSEHGKRKLYRVIFSAFRLFLLKRQNHVHFSFSFNLVFQNGEFHNFLCLILSIVTFPRTYRRFNELLFSSRRQNTFFYRVDRKWKIYHATVSIEIPQNFSMLLINNSNLIFGCRHNFSYKL